jgi:hypothetical protein
MGTSSSLTGSKAPNTQDTCGLRQKGWDLYSVLRAAQGEPKRIEETEPCEQSRVSMVGSESTELEVEQGCTRDRGGGKGDGVGHTQCRKRAVAAMNISPINGESVRLGHPEAGPQNQWYQQAGRESQCRDE